MKLEEVVKYLKYKNRDLLSGILTSSEEHPIVYLDDDDFKNLGEYKILDFLAENKYLEKEEHGRLIYFVLTELGKDCLASKYKS